MFDCKGPFYPEPSGVHPAASFSRKVPHELLGVRVLGAPPGGSPWNGPLRAVAALMRLVVPSTASAVLVPGRLETEDRGHHHHQCPGEQHLPDQSGHQWERHGRHGSQDAGQGAADQHQAQVRGLSSAPGCGAWGAGPKEGPRKPWKRSWPPSIGELSQWGLRFPSGQRGRRGSGFQSLSKCRGRGSRI